MVQTHKNNSENVFLNKNAKLKDIFTGIGYKELFPYFKGEQSLAEASEILKRNTRRFAKRQLTWFRNRMEVTFYAISAPHFKEQVLADVKEFLQHD